MFLPCCAYLESELNLQDDLCDITTSLEANHGPLLVLWVRVRVSDGENLQPPPHIC